MERIKFLTKTRIDVSPQGKPKVYFCATPKDYELYFETVSDEVMKYQGDVAFYYLESSESNVDEVSVEGKAQFEDSLKEMQLFVIPLTSEFLLTQNRARLFDYEIAIKSNIPVLLLAMEPNLCKTIPNFNDLIKRRQYINKYNTDSTAIPYEEKLKTFLEKVIVGDELAQQVRDAFDTYIFLSYRKKDRKYAKEIMHLIHENEFCRDIAIWYDEFIALGEDFNISIQKAFEKSGLFVLSVTPSLLEENNYIMRIEYPLAAKSDIDVLPIEIVPTDREALEGYYENIPECLSDKKDIACWLEKFASKTMNSNRDDAKHLFFMGLAYLSGIDVEVNGERALKLLTRSAEQNLPEAYEKLVTMYQTGMGVERNYDIAIDWQEKYVKYLEERFNESKSDDDMDNLVRELQNLIDYCYNNWSYDKCREYCSKLNDYLETIGNEKWLRIMYISNSWLGMVSMTERKLTEAQEYFQKALNIAIRLSDEEESLQSASDLSLIYGRLGELSELEGKLKETIDYYTKVLNIDAKLLKKSRQGRIFKSLASAYDKLGDVLLNKMGKISVAKELYLNSLEIFEMLADERGTAESLNDLSLCYEKLGNAAKAEGKIAETKEYYFKCLEIRKRTACETEAVVFIDNLSVCYISLGDVFKLEGKVREAKEYYLNALKIQEGLVSKTGTVGLLRRIAVSYDRLGDVANEEGCIDEAKEYYSKATNIRERLVNETETIQALRDLSISYDRLGDISKARGDLLETKEYYLKSLEIRERLVNESETVEALRDLSISYERLGALFKEEGRISKAKEYYFNSFKIDEKLAKNTGNVQSLRELSISYEHLGEVAKAEGNIAEAKEYYFQSLEIIERLANETGTVKSLNDLIYNYGVLEKILKLEGNETEAEKYHRKALEIQELLNKRT